MDELMSDIDHRALGSQLFNATWALIEREDRTADDDVEMLLSAAASRWHWGRIGGPAEIATGDWQVAHVGSLLGLSDVALLFAERNLRAAIEQGWTGWQLASAHEGLARALAAAADADGRAHHVAEARAALADEPDAEERAAIASQIDSIPPAGSSPTGRGSGPGSQR